MFRFNIKGKETLSGAYKYYLNDLSFKNYLYPGFEYGLGYKLENAVYLQLLFSGYTVYVGALRNREVDFVARKANRTVYLQCTYLLIDRATINRLRIRDALKTVGVFSPELIGEFPIPGNG